VPLGSAARFKWEFTFGDSKDWGNFVVFIWGKKDNSFSYMMTKYITVHKSGISILNPALHASVRSRAFWTGNISQQQGCQLVFILKNVPKSDQTTYGCTADVSGISIRTGPINLVVSGECAWRIMSLSISIYKLIFCQFLNLPFNLSLKMTVH